MDESNIRQSMRRTNKKAEIKRAEDNGKKRVQCEKLYGDNILLELMISYLHLVLQIVNIMRRSNRKKCPASLNQQCQEFQELIVFIWQSTSYICWQHLEEFHIHLKILHLIP